MHRSWQMLLRHSFEIKSGPRSFRQLSPFTLVLVRQAHLASPGGVIVVVACFVDLCLMTVATRWVHRPLAHPGPVITSCFFLHFIIEQTVCWEEGAPACRLPSLSFYLPVQCCTLGIIDLLAWKQTINCVTGVRSFVCLEIIYQSQSSLFLLCRATAILHLLARQSARNVPHLMPHDLLEGFQTGWRRIINPKKHQPF